jgi:hypothetical protein
VRPGYLAALASRAIGVAPVLRPATPSRFEPVATQAERHEMTETRGAGPAPAATPRQVPDRPDETVADALLEADRSLLGFFAAGIAGEPHPVQVAQDGWAAPGVTRAGGEPAEAAGRSRRRAALPARDLADALSAADRPLRGFFGADIAGEPRPVQVGQDGWAAPGVTRAGGEPAGAAGRSRRGAPLPATAATGVEALANAAALTPDAAEAPSGEAWSGRGTWQEGAVQTARAGQQARAAGRAGEPEAARSTEPAIVVRIGRVDVRAVPAAHPPAPPPRPRPAAGPSLAEYLRARDRGRR